MLILNTAKINWVRNNDKCQLSDTSGEVQANFDKGWNMNHEYLGTYWLNS